MVSNKKRNWGFGICVCCWINFSGCNLDVYMLCLLVFIRCSGVCISLCFSWWFIVYSFMNVFIVGGWGVLKK